MTGSVNLWPEVEAAIGRAGLSDAGADAVRLTAELVAIDSVNPGLVADAVGERGIVDRLRARLARAGFDVTVIQTPGRAGRPSLLAAPRGPADGPTIVLNGHLDTVGVDGMDAPFSPRVDGDRLLGRGAADMKGGVAALVVAAERLVAGGAPVRPVLALVADEEDANVGSETVVAALPGLGIEPVACLIAEPTGLATSRSLRGFAVVQVTLPGKAAHSSQGELGTNAVTHLGRLLHAVDIAAPDVRSRGGDLMVTLARGGTSAFVVPDHAECLIELRLPPGEPSHRALARVEAMLDPDWQATATLLAARDGWLVDEAGVGAAFNTALAERLGAGTEFAAPYWMEAPLWQAVCPTVVCGPTGGGLHAVDEWVSIGQVADFTDGLIDVLRNWQVGEQVRRTHEGDGTAYRE